ncbi:MAG: AbrB/MazE/SpoVT family DNA-binding domain-containing protein [Terracidiphilus sp.]|jgi:antitoxin ChpS
MHTTNLRKVGGSVMLAVPPAMLDQLRLKAGATVGLAVDGDRLILKPQTRPRYSLDELLAASDFSQPLTPEEREWIDAPPIGRELL